MLSEGDIRSIRSKIVKLERVQQELGTIPRWAFTAALAERNRRLASYKLGTKIVAARNRVANMRGEALEPMPERPEFAGLEIEAAQLYERFGTESEYEASLPGPVDLADSVRRARERRIRHE